MATGVVGEYQGALNIQASDASALNFGSSAIVGVYAAAASFVPISLGSYLTYSVAIGASGGTVNLNALYLQDLFDATAPIVLTKDLSSPYHIAISLSTVSVAKGGTGLTDIPQYALLCGNDTATATSIASAAGFLKGAVGVLPAYTALALTDLPAGSGYLKGTASTPVYSYIDGGDITTGVVDMDRGGTSLQGGWAAGDIMYAISSSQMGRRGRNSTATRKFLRSDSSASAPNWDTVTWADVGGSGTASSPVFTGATIGSLTGILNAASGVVSTSGIGASLEYKSSSLNTIQDIQTTATPRFAKIGIGQASDASYPLAVSGASKLSGAIWAVANTGTTQVSGTIESAAVMAYGSASSAASKQISMFSHTAGTITQTTAALDAETYLAETGFATAVAAGTASCFHAVPYYSGAGTWTHKTCFWADGRYSPNSGFYASGCGISAGYAATVASGYIVASGRIGVGTSSPSYPLHVSGDVALVSGRTGINTTPGSVERLYVNSASTDVYAIYTSGAPTKTSGTLSYYIMNGGYMNMSLVSGTGTITEFIQYYGGDGAAVGAGGTVTRAYTARFGRPPGGTSRWALYAEDVVIGASNVTTTAPSNGLLVQGAIKNDNLTASSLVATDASKQLTSTTSGIAATLTSVTLGSGTAFNTYVEATVTGVTVNGYDAGAPVTNYSYDYVITGSKMVSLHLRQCLSTIQAIVVQLNLTLTAAIRPPATTQYGLIFTSEAGTDYVGSWNLTTGGVLTINRGPNQAVTAWTAAAANGGWKEQTIVYYLR